MVSSLNQAANLSAAIRGILSGGSTARIIDDDSSIVNLARCLGRAAGLTEKRLLDLALVAKVFDVGAAWMPSRTLLKKSTLVDEEWEEITQHVAIGYEVAQATPEISHLAEIILHHHEWWDGSGYPGSCRGESIPLESRIIAIVDAYDSMTSGRPYREPRSHAEALNEIRRCAGTQFDPELVRIFLGLA